LLDLLLLFFDRVEGFAIPGIQPAPKARQKVARGEREARGPWNRSDKNNRALKGRIKQLGRLSNSVSTCLDIQRFWKFFMPFQGESCY